MLLASPPPSYRPVTLGGMIRAAATRLPGKTAIRVAEHHVTYANLVERMNRIANAAAGRGIGAGDVVALIAPNCAEYIEIVAGLSDAGIVVATLNPRLTPREFGAILEDCKPRLIIAADSIVTAIAEDLPSLPAIALGEEYEAWLSGASPAFTPPEIAEWNPFSISYTSGTTGLPKGVLLSHRSRVLTIYGMAAEYACFGPDDHFIAVAPLYHGAGFAFAVANVALGGTTEILTHFDPAEVMTILGRGEATSIFFVPTHLKRLVDLPEDAFAAGRDNRLKAIICNAAALPQPLKERAIAAFGEGLLFESYGSTEGGIVTSIRPADQLRKINCVGLPFPGNEIEIRSETGSIQPPGVPGELFSRSPYFFISYLNRPEETAETLQDGWVTCGDMAMRDEEGYIYIVDRKKDLIVSGGVNVYPREVENVILTVPGVAEVAVVGLPDAEWGERIHAFVVKDTGADVTAEAIQSACREALAGFKQPRGISFIDELPRNAGGKLLKKDLRERAV